MPHATDLLGLAGSALAIVAVAVATARATGLRRPALSWIAGAGALVALAPVAALPVAGHLRGAIGDLSVTSLVLLVATLARQLRGLAPPGPRDTFALQLLVAAAGLLLYPLTLGLGPFDPYRLGYGGPVPLGVLLAITLGCLVLELRLVAWCVSLGVLAWGVGGYESRNLWDHLLDPLVWAWGLGTLCGHGARALWRIGVGLPASGRGALVDHLVDAPDGGRLEADP